MTQTPARIDKRNAAIPPELKALAQWAGVYRGNGNKQPGYPNGNEMKWGTRSNWCTFPQVTRLPDIMFIISPESGLGGIDFDGCVSNGVIHPLVLDWCLRSHSYAEISESGHGVKLFLRANLPNHKKFRNIDVPWKQPDDDHAGIEVHTWQPFHITGNKVDGCTSKIVEAPDVLNEIMTRFAPKPKGAAHSTGEQKEWDFEGWINRHVEVIEWLSDGCIIPCPWAHEHSTPGDTARVWKGPPHTFHCFHSHCQGRTWSDVRLKYEPNAYTRREEYQEYKPGSSTASNGNGAAPANNAHGSFNLTDLGNAERFAAHYHNQVRWCETWNSWLIFNGKYWKQDQSGKVDQLAKKTVRSILIEAANEPDKERYRLLLKHAVASESNRSIRALLDRAKSELPATPDEFNTHLHLLNCKNGTLDLRTGELRPHSYADMLTRCLKINYNPLAPYPKWLQFISSIFACNQSLIDFMQQALGMSLSGDVSEQCLFIGHGGGSNGKTTLFETVRIILGEYGLAANIETFQMRKGERINNDVAELYGARFVTADENTQGSRLNEAFIKKATGKQPLRARRLHENEFQFMPEFTIWFAVNHKPVVKDTSKGMWRRVHFVPFNVTIEGDQVDKHLGEKLLEEAEGILAWLVQGCIAWSRLGHLNVPQAVQDATQAYRTEMDIIARFLDECCETAPNQEIGATVLYQAYKKWCEDTGEYWETQNLFGARLTERGYRKERTRKGFVYRGVNLVNLVNLEMDFSTRGTDATQKSAKQGSQGSQGSQTEEDKCSGCGDDEVEHYDPNGLAYCAECWQAALAERQVRV